MADIVEKVEKSIAEDLVVSKYKLAGEIVNRTLKAVIDLCAAGKSYLHQIWCSYHRSNKQSLQKRKGFPNCLSVNDCVCHLSPSKKDPDYALKDGMLLK